MIEEKKNSKSLLNKIEIHQDYLKEKEFMNTTKMINMEQNTLYETWRRQDREISFKEL